VPSFRPRQISSCPSVTNLPGRGHKQNLSIVTSPVVIRVIFTQAGNVEIWLADRDEVGPEPAYRVPGQPAISAEECNGCFLLLNLLSKLCEDEAAASPEGEESVIAVELHCQPGGIPGQGPFVRTHSSHDLLLAMGVCRLWPRNAVDRSVST
jgi:hypothetical protein